MKICILSYRGNMYSGGQGIYLYYLTRELARLGHEILVLCGPPYPADMPWAKLIRIENQNFYAVKKGWLPRPDPLRIFTPLNFYEFMVTRLWFFPEMLTFSLRALGKMRELWNAGERWDIIHDNQCLAYGYLAMKAFGVPVIASIHHPLGMDQSADFEQTQGLKERARRVVFYPLIMQKIVSRHMDLVISGSQESADSVCRAFKIDTEKMRVIYDGVDDDVFTIRKTTGKVPQRLIFVGNTEDRKKGIMYLMEALAMLPREVSLLVVDGCSRYKFLANWLILKHHLEGRVSYRERITAEELADEYRRSEIGVVPSVYEGFGLPAAEAMACGIPVVATDGGALPEVIGPHGDGIIVPKKNSAELARAIKTLLDNPRLREDLGKRGHQRAMDMFTWRQMAIHTAEVYREAIELRRGKNKNAHR